MKTSILLYILFLAMLSGCVSISKYNKVVRANADQRTRIEKTSKKNKALEQRIQELQDSLALYSSAGSVKSYATKTNTYSNFKKDAAVDYSTDSFQNDEEKRILYYMNYARVKPREFLKKYVLPNLRDTSGYYQKTLIETLRKMQPVEALLASRRMFELAECHAKASGKSGYVGHSREKEACNVKGYYNAECCAYGRASFCSDEALNYVLQLLVDDGVRSLGHREIILMNWLKTVGVSIQPHITYGENVVIDFSSSH